MKQSSDALSRIGHTIFILFHSSEKCSGFGDEGPYIRYCSEPAGNETYDRNAQKVNETKPASLADRYAMQSHTRVPRAFGSPRR